MVVFFSQWVPSRTTNQDVDEPIITTKLKPNTQEIGV